MYVVVFTSSQYFIKLFAVKRVHWLRARAQKMRWREECIILRYEMQRTVRFFLHKSTYWTQALSPEGRELSPGAAAYAHRKVRMWCDLARYADQSYKNCNNHYQSVL
jgi:hypothetical protein